MAKKQKKELTPEERLAAARVPKEEWPYELPEGWEWVRLEGVNQYKSCSIDPKKFPDEIFELYSVPSSADNYPEIIEGSEIGSSKQAVQEGDVLLCKINPRINRVWKVSQYTDHPLLASSEWIVVRNDQINSNYLMRYFQSDVFRKYMLSNVSGVGGSLMRAQPKFVKTYPVPLPPLETQQRIVDHIESLFAKLDQAKEKAQQALATAETRKAAILHQAFTGQLTAHWREKNGVGMETWKTVKLQDVCEKIVCGKTPTEFISPEGEIPFLKVYNIVDNTLDFESKPQFIPREVHEGKLKSSILKPHDVIMNIVGPPLRKIAIIPDTYSEWNMNQAIVRFRPQKELNYQFLYYALIYPKTLDDVILETKGVVGQANISLTQSRNLIIKLPTDSEQVKIVELIKNLYLKIEKEQDYIKKVLLRIERIRESILHQAFVGRLTRKGV